jgi:DNA-binding transcriptional ArsR family regulator
MGVFIADGQTRTSIDSLLDLINANGRMDINSVASKLGVAPSVVENWAKVLEKSGLITVKYEVGKMFIEPASTQKGDSKTLNAKLDVQQSSLSTDAEAKMLELQKLSEMLDNLRATALSANKIYSEKMPELQSRLGEINKVYEQVEKENKVVNDMRVNLEKTYEGINNKVSDMLKKLDYLDSGDFSTKLNDSISKVEGLLKGSGSTDEKLKTVRAEKEKAIATLKSDLENQFKKLRQDLETSDKEVEEELRKHEQDIKVYNEGLKEQLRVSKDLLKQVSDFKKEKEKEKKALNEAVREFTDRYTKSYSIVSKDMGILEHDSKSIMADIFNLKDNFGGAANVYDTLLGIQKDADEMKAKVADARESLQKMQDDIRLLTKGNIGIAERASKLDSIEKASASIDKNIIDMKGTLEADLQKFGDGSGGKPAQKPAKGKPTKK